MASHNASSVWIDPQAEPVDADRAKQAFSVNAYPDDPLQNFTFSNINVQAQTAGIIADAHNWTFSNVNIQSADGSKIKLQDCSAMKGVQ
jgi:hypothetical protein